MILSSTLQKILRDHAPISLSQFKALALADKDVIKHLILTNTFFLSEYVLRSRSMPPLRQFHRDICEFFPACDPEAEISEWAAVGKPKSIRRRVLLAPRGTLKTTLSAAHLLQAILCFPDIRILIIGATLAKAQALSESIRKYCENPIIKYLFPQDFVKESGGHTTTARADLSLFSPTLVTGSFRAIPTGSHADYVWLDDAASNRRSIRSISKSVEAYDDLDPILEPNGLLAFVGTRWGAEDLPEAIRQHGKVMEAETGETLVDWLEIPVWTVRKSEDPGEQTAIDAREINNSLTPEDVILLWPEKLTADFLFPIYQKSPALFQAQYLMRVTALTEPQTVTFTRELLKTVIKPSSYVPGLNDSVGVLNGDLASLTKAGRDKCCLISGLYNIKRKTLFVWDVFLQKVESDAELLKHTEGMYRAFDQSPFEIQFRIEDSKEAKAQLDSLLTSLGMTVTWEYPQTYRDARLKRILNLCNGFREGRVELCQDLHFADEVEKQLLSWKARVKHQADDFIDSLAQLWEFCENIEAVPIRFDSRIPPIKPGDGFEDDLPMPAPIRNTARQLARYEEARAAEEQWRQLTPVVLETDTVQDPAYFAELGISNKFGEL
jgi:hypothetical protein